MSLRVGPSAASGIAQDQAHFSIAQFGILGEFSSLLPTDMVRNLGLRLRAAHAQHLRLRGAHSLAYEGSERALAALRGALAPAGIDIVEPFAAESYT